MSTVVYIVRIAGYTTGARAQPVAFTTASAQVAKLGYIGATYLRRRLASVPRMTGARLGLLAPSATGGAWSVRVVFDNSDEVVFGLNSVQPSPLLNSNGEALRPHRYIRAADTSFRLRGNAVGVSVGDHIYLNSECMLVTAVSSSSLGGVLTVSRGQLDTVAVDHPNVSNLVGGPVIYTRRPDLVGARVEIARCSPSASSRADEVVVGRGIIDDISYGGGVLDLTIAPMQRLLQGSVGQTARRWAPPRLNLSVDVDYGSTLILRADGQFVHAGAGGSLIADAEYPKADAETWLYWRVVCGGAWAVFRYSVSATDVVIANDSETGDEDQNDYTLLRYSVAATTPIQVGRGTEVFARSAWSEVFQVEQSYTIDFVEYVDVWTGSNARLSTVITDIIGADGTRPWTVSMRLGADDYDAESFGVLDRALDAEALYSEHTEVISSVRPFVFPFIDEDNQLLSVLEKQFFEPTFTALGTSNTGALRCIEHRDVFAPSITLTATRLRTETGDAPRLTWRRSRGDILREVVYTAKVGGVTRTDRVTSDIATSIHAAGQERRFELAALAAHQAQLVARAQALLSTYEVAAVELAIQVDGSDPIEPGDTVLVTMEAAPASTGQRGATTTRYKVLQRSEDVAGTQVLQGHLLGEDLGARWAPCADVTSYAAGTGRIYIDMAPYVVDPDNVPVPSTYWQVGDAILLHTESLARRSATTMPLTGVGVDSTGPYLQVASVPVAPVAGDIVGLAGYDATAARDWGFWADESGVLGAANDRAAVWG